jgi:hypothetical protein
MGGGARLDLLANPSGNKGSLTGPKPPQERHGSTGKSELPATCASLLNTIEGGLGSHSLPCVAYLAGIGVRHALASAFEMGLNL